MTVEDGQPWAVRGRADSRTHSDAEAPHRLQFAAAVEEGTPVVHGDHLPDRTPENEAELPPRMVIKADTLRKVLLDRDLAARADPRGLTIKGAVIVGELNLDHIVIDYPLGLIDCWFGDSFTLEQATLRALDLNGSHFDGVIELPGAHVAGLLVMTGATLDGVNTFGDSLVAENLRADSDVLLDEGFTSAGAIRLTGADVAGALVMNGATLNGTNSLIADRLRTDSSTFLDKGSLDKAFTAAGAIRLPGARIGGQLIFRGASLEGPIRLTGAHIKGQLNLRGATLDGATARGDSLIADHLQADSDVVLDEEFTAVGGIRLNSAHIGGQLNLRGAMLTGTKANENILTAARLQADGDVLFDGGFSAAGTILLRLARIGNLVVGDDAQSLPQLGDVTGWRIGDVHGVIRTDRGIAADWLSSQPAAHPWQELAAVYERNGQPADARWIRYRSAVQTTHNTKGFMQRLLRRIYRVTTGHGYYPLVALIWLLAIFALAWSLTAVWKDDFTTATTDAIRADLIARDEAVATSGDEDPTIPDPIPGRIQAVWCTDNWDVACLSPAVYALTTAFPATSTAQLWAPPREGWALALTVAFYMLRLLAWVFTAILLAGLTGLLRQQT
jgi:uncharacterized protein YjbI with pentapeptide repeats